MDPWRGSGRRSQRSGSGRRVPHELGQVTISLDGLGGAVRFFEDLRITLYKL